MKTFCIEINKEQPEWKGIVEFFKDGNGVGESWIDFSHDITTELVH